DRRRLGWAARQSSEACRRGAGRLRTRAEGTHRRKRGPDAGGSRGALWKPRRRTGAGAAHARRARRTRAHAHARPLFVRQRGRARECRVGNRGPRGRHIGAVGIPIRRRSRPMNVGATPFHACTSVHNRAQAWVTRGYFTVPQFYSEPRQEALAARTSAVLIDFSAMERIRVHGTGAARLLSAACGRAVNELPIGQSCAVVWRGDGGGVRGYGTLARAGESNFALQAFAA